MQSLSRHGLILLAGLLTFCIPLTVQALTTDELDVLIKDKGLDVGVQNALTEGMGIEDIIVTALVTKNHNVKDILLTLCIKGANNADIRSAAMSQEISPLIFSSAMESCATTQPDAQAYTPEDAKRPQPPKPEPPKKPEPPASPATF